MGAVCGAVHYGIVFMAFCSASLLSFYPFSRRSHSYKKTGDLLPGHEANQRNLFFKDDVMSVIYKPTKYNKTFSMFLPQSLPGGGGALTF